MNLSSFNPFKGTRFAGSFNLTVGILKFIVQTAPITLEVFLHRQFGARTAKDLLKGFLLLLIVSVISRNEKEKPMLSLFPFFLLAYTLLSFRHWYVSQFGEGVAEIHSYSTGEPLPFWRRVPVTTSAVEQYLEPALCWFTALVVWSIDSSLGIWIAFAASALFVKEQLRRSQLRTRRLDALDSRIETGRLVPRATRENEPFVEARPAPRPNRPHQ